jgi:hypothetical protein
MENTEENPNNSTTTTTHFPYLFTIQLTFPLYFPSLFTCGGGGKLL